MEGENSSSPQASEDRHTPLCRFKTHEFSERLMNISVTFFVLKLKDSFFLWIGSRPTLGELSIAMMTPFKNFPIATNVFGDFSNLTSQNLASRLAMRCDKQVYVSCNISQADSLLLPLIEKRLQDEMDRHPDKF